MTWKIEDLSPPELAEISELKILMSKRAGREVSVAAISAPKPATGDEARL